MIDDRAMATTHVDVLIVGAGLAGIGVAHHLQRKCPNKRYVILEARDTLGGTWDLFKYPGIRSDSSMHLYGYSFKPWTDDRSIAPGETILEYLREAAEDAGIHEKIRYNTKVVGASWSSEDGQWTITAKRTDTGETETYTTNWLQMCSGYYSYEKGYTPEFAGRDRFEGDIIHPQGWPQDYDYSGKRIVVIGSGATAITLIPSLVDKAKHVTMLQRSPTYILVQPNEDVVAKTFRRVFGSEVAYNLTRKKNIFLERLIFKTARNKPEKLIRFLEKPIRKLLPDDYDMRHFRPHYKPWDQRLCVCPDGDFFKAIERGDASVVTDHIDTFTEKGIRLKSGEELEADLIVTATGLALEVGGGAKFAVDGSTTEQKDHWIYKGVMLSNVPNMMLTAGTLIASYTLRVELIADYLCRVLQHMDRTGTRVARPELPLPKDEMPVLPFIDGFNSGYIMRAVETFPKQGAAHPWRNVQGYLENKKVLEAPVEDGVLVFSGERRSAKSEANRGPDSPALGSIHPRAAQ